MKFSFVFSFAFAFAFVVTLAKTVHINVPCTYSVDKYTSSFSDFWEAMASETEAYFRRHFATSFHDVYDYYYRSDLKDSAGRCFIQEKYVHGYYSTEVTCNEYYGECYSYENPPPGFEPIYAFTKDREFEYDLKSEDQSCSVLGHDTDCTAFYLSGKSSVYLDSNNQVRYYSAGSGGNSYKLYWNSREPDAGSFIVKMCENATYLSASPLDSTCSASMIKTCLALIVAAVAVTSFCVN